MRFKKIALALFACMALGALAANVAQAGQWTVGTTENQTTAGTKITKENVSCKRHGTTPLVFTSTLLGAAVEITASGVDCVNATIDTTEAGVDHSEGELTFTDVTVVKPAHCMVPNDELTTGKLTDEVIMDPSGGAVTFDKFFTDPVGGVAQPFVTIPLTGVECALDGNSAQVFGSACGEAVHTNAAGTGFEPNNTGTLTKVQTLLFGSAQQTTGGCALTFGKAAATLSGAVDNELSGTNVGKPFGAD
jgi:hypothetical protein